MAGDETGRESCPNCGGSLPVGVYRCGTCGEPTARGTVRVIAGRTLTTLEQAALVGAGLAIIGLVLPATRTGPSLAVLRPVAAVVLAMATGTAAASLFTARPAVRMAVVLVLGGCLAVVGVALSLGLPRVGLGVLAVTAGGFLAATVGFTGYSRHRSFTRAMVVGWLSTLAITTALLVAAQTL